MLKSTVIHVFLSEESICYPDFPIIHKFPKSTVYLLPSGKLLVCSWEWPFSSLIYPLKRVIFHSYVTRMYISSQIFQVFHMENIFPNIPGISYGESPCFMGKDIFYMFSPKSFPIFFQSPDHPLVLVATLLQTAMWPTNVAALHLDIYGAEKYGWYMGDVWVIAIIYLYVYIYI